MSFVSRIACVVLLGFAPLAQAGKPHYLPADALDAIGLLPAPPAADSEEACAERDFMVALQDRRTPAQIARCRSEVKVTLAAFASVLGPWCTEEGLPRVAELLKRAEHDALYFADQAKDHFQRKRPAAEDPRIQIAVVNEATPSYPSCHSTRGMLCALLLAEMAPRQREALLARGREVGWDRVIAGMHPPSDIVAGRVVAQAVAQALLANRRFRDELLAARRELEQAADRAALASGSPLQ
jgi:acid phosphatase (class A)